ncbi:MAG: ATP-binding cassette domain-containing protein [Elusimicrobiota bacterium]|nr:ATP-binding cassette domain-containing protein [Elusimicrobiota bacterium]
MIELRNVNKVFKTKASEVRALKNVSVKIEEGEIFGVIGLSGAGKSTLIRCINLLERPDSGEVIVDGDDLMKFNPNQIREKRQEIGMIFQLFNLFRSRTIAENIAFPLLNKKHSQKEIDDRVNELLELVGLESKINGYPSQLSGGQKQRVGIARALATHPKILLCDEATSALDPKTTQSILALLKDLNKKLNLTIVIVTHEMGVIKSICNEVAVMEGGEVIESGEVFHIFANPQHKLTKDFITTTSSLKKTYDLLEENSIVMQLKPGEVLAHFEYIGPSSIEALVSTLSIKFNIHLNIIFADLDIILDLPMGGLILIISGPAEAQAAAFEYISKKGVKVEVIKKYGDN